MPTSPPNKRITNRPLQEQLRDAERHLRAFVRDGDLGKDKADKILEGLRRDVKTRRADQV